MVTAKPFFLNITRNYKICQKIFKFFQNVVIFIQLDELDELDRMTHAWIGFNYYRPQQSWAKVIFSQACVCPQGGSASVHAGIYPPRTRPTPRDQTPQHQTPWDQAHPPDTGPPLAPDPPPPGSRLQHTVNERPVRILLECILVLWIFSKFSFVELI